MLKVQASSSNLPIPYSLQSRVHHFCGIASRISIGSMVSVLYARLSLQPGINIIFSHSFMHVWERVLIRRCVSSPSTIFRHKYALELSRIRITAIRTSEGLLYLFASLLPSSKKKHKIGVKNFGKN